MAVVRGFKGIRPNGKFAEQIATLPYDVMNRKEAREMAEGNPISFLRVSRSDIEFGDDVGQYEECVYEKAKENLDKLVSDGYMIEDSKPIVYIYEQVMDGRSQTGIVGCVSIDEYADNTIKKHELTRVEKELDRINHFYVCQANTEPIFLTYRDDKRINALVESYKNRKKPEYDLFKGNVRHILWAVTEDDVVNGICGLFKEVPCLYIADGHHRSASGYKVGERCRKEAGSYDGNEEFNFVMATIFPDSQLAVMDYNRVIKDLNGNSINEFIDKIKESGFTVEKVDGQCKPEEKGQFGMFLNNSWYKLTADKGLYTEDAVGSLDVTVLQNNIISKLLGIDDPRTDSRIDFVGGIKGMDELEKRVKTDMSVAFSLYPVQISDIMNISDSDLIMPPKSTWFEPKLASGLFVHKF